ncbi:serine hydrolase [Limoniibacter endophyticus]|uniref:beta-lactamase n=1 Tax=Limoniibacter endophyticus TaxID=1565040 RepID=A0A8J3DSS9_9HYPH|nr:serine hydrolase [Limoniibacter endophyticus]GHC78885.1 serine hydrolase [Limoniibacter endophyticus]
MTPSLITSPGLEPLAEELNALCDAQHFTTSFALRHLPTGSEIGRDAEVVTASASTRKILFMAAALAAVNEGKLSLDEELTLTPDLMEGPVSGILYFLTPGLKFPLRDAIVLMIILSDNVCTSLVGERVGLPAISSYAARLGMKGTTIREIVPPRHMPITSDFDFVGQTTPNDQITLLQAILDGTADADAAARIGLTPDLCAYAIKVLGQQQYRTRIPALLPRTTFFAGKTGTGRQGAMDVGIVYSDGIPLYAIAVYASELPVTLPDGRSGHAIADTIIAALSRLAWDHFQL